MANEADGNTTWVLASARPGSNGAVEAACLVTIYGPSLGRRIDLDAAETVIGRGSSCDVVLPVSDVSRRHTRIQRTGGGWLAEDLDSTNGTFVNDERLLPGVPHALRSGDLLNLAGVIFKVLDGNHIEASYHEEIYRTAIVDGLTQIPNRRYLEEFVEAELPRARRYARPLAMLLFDVDHFKDINDQCGHVAGDHVLREIARVVGSGLRGECCFARYGGEEFAVVLPETSFSEALIVAERIRGLVEVHEFRAGGALVPVTISIGVSALDAEIEQANQLYHCADQRLYEAKSAGRNCVRSGLE
jgi:diguanylate cyclase (GGDEF)-like protein